MRKWYKMLLVWLRVALLVYVGLMAVLFLAQRKLIFPVSRTVTRVPSDMPYKLAYEDLTLPVAGGGTMNAWYVPADGASHTVLFCRGNGGTLSDWLDVMLLFHRLQLNILVFDYSGYGRSSGSPNEKSLYANGRAAWQYLVDTRRTPAGQIIIIGHSIGGGVATELAREFHPAALVLQSTFTSMGQVCQDHVPWFPAKWLVLDRFNSAAKIQAITCPKLIIHSPEDSLINIRHGKKLYELAGEPKTFVEFKGDHNDGMWASGSIYTDAISALVKRLRQAEAPAS